MTRSRGFWNLIARRYARQPVADQAAYDYKLAQTKALLDPDMHLFEFGCGTGTTALIHAPFVAQIDAIDYAPQMIAIANSKKGTAQCVNFAVSTLRDWPAADASYDMILGMSILHLLPDRHGALDHVNRLLKPGGYFVTSTVCLRDMGPLVNALLPIGAALRVLPRVVSLDAPQLEQDFKQAGFAIRQSWRPHAKGDVFHICQKPR